MPSPPAALEYEVSDFKGMHAVFRGPKLVTRTNDEDAAKAYAASANAAPANRKPFASKLEQIDTGE